MIDPKQGPLFHPGRREQRIAHSKPKLAPSSAAKSPELVRRLPMPTVVK